MNRSTKHFGRLLALLILITVALAGCGGESAPAPVADAPATQPAATEAAVEAPAEAVEALSLPLNIDAALTNDIRNRDDVVILDVREDWEYAEGHVPGATLISLGDLPARLADIPTDKTVIAVCRSGNRSNQATAFLRGQGFENVHNMTGGMISWEQAGFDVEK